jgi:hypothetical protein
MPDPEEPDLADEPPDEAGAADKADEADEADEAEVVALADRFRSLVDSRRPPPGPIVEPWALGVGDLLTEIPKVPKRLHGVVRRLNRFGGIAIAPATIGFDGDDVDWSKVTEVRTRHVVDYLLGDAVQAQVERLPLPWFPGRRRALDALGKALLTLTIATAKSQLDDRGPDLRVPAEVEYRALLGRRKTLNAGVVGALVLADPGVRQSVLATAEARGVPVRPAADELLDDATQRAAAVRAKVAELETALARFSQRFGRRG